jgi:hypothetical protein
VLCICVVCSFWNGLGDFSFAASHWALGMLVIEMTRQLLKIVLGVRGFVSMGSLHSANTAGSESCDRFLFPEILVVNKVGSSVQGIITVRNSNRYILFAHATVISMSRCQNR